LRYRDFANRYPNDPDRDYALLMLGQTYAANRKRPDRDLSTLQESMAAYNQLITLYPDSPHVPEARECIAELREILAEHEFQVATFYSRNRHWRGVMWRLQYLKEKYPDYSRIDEVDELLATASQIISDREEAIAKFREELEKRQREMAEENDAETEDDSDSR
jgi:outer membrane protein assembly factor BamD